MSIHNQESNNTAGALKPLLSGRSSNFIPNQRQDISSSKYQERDENDLDRTNQLSVGDQIQFEGQRGVVTKTMRNLVQFKLDNSPELLIKPYEDLKMTVLLYL